MAKIYNILNYGASTDGKLCTKQIQTAIDECFFNGGGEVIIPAGDFLTGGLRIRSNVTLHLLEDAQLLGSISPDDYFEFLDDKIEPISTEDIDEFASDALNFKNNCTSIKPYSRWNNAIIRAINAENIAIIGDKGSKINGQNCFDEHGEEKYRGPHAINMWFCKNIKLDGYTIVDSANWAHAIQNSQNITINNVTILGGHDGFDVRTCDNVLVENCVFKTGDDCIAGFDNINVTVRNCVFDTACSILRFGGTNVLVEDCKSYAPSTYGFRGSLSDEEKKNRAQTNENSRYNCLNVFLYYCDFRAEIRENPSNIVIKNSYFKNPDAIMRIPFGTHWCCNRALYDITFENCTFDGVVKASEITCPENEPLTLKFKDCTVIPRAGFEGQNLIDGKNLKKIVLDNFKTEGFINPEIICEPETEIINK